MSDEELLESYRNANQLNLYTETSSVQNFHKARDWIL